MGQRVRTASGFARNAADVAAATMVSRLLGFARDVLVAAALGAGPVADAFVVAVRLPSLMRRLFAEGAFNTAFIPLYGEAEARGGGARFAGEVFSAIGLAFLMITAVALAAMPLVVDAIAPGLSQERGEVALAVELSRITFPYCLSTALMVVAAALLNATGRFTAAAIAPALVNVAILLALLTLATAGIEGARAARMLAFAMLAGSIAQCLLVFAAFWRAGLRLHLVVPRLSHGLRRFLLLAGPGLVAAAITQVNALVALVVASSRPGAITWLYYADRLYQLPLGIIAVAVGVALLPAIAAGRLDEAGRRHAISRATEGTLFLGLPAAIGLAMAGGPICAALFERGAFSAADSAATGAALAVMALGLPAFVAAKVLQSLYFARATMRPPFLVALLGIATDVGVSILMFPRFGHIGIAMGCAASGWVNALALAVLARRDGLLTLDADARRRLPRMASAAAIMGLALAALLPALHGLAPVPRLVAICGSGVLVYAAAGLALGAVVPASVFASLRRRNRRAAGPS